MKRALLLLTVLFAGVAAADTPYSPRPGIDPHVPTTLTGLRYANGTGLDTVATPAQVAASINAPVILATVTGINAFTVANTALYTVPTGKTCVVTGYVVRVTAASGVTAGPTAGVGNVAGTNNIATSQGESALTSTTSAFSWPTVGMTTITPAAGVVYFNLNTAATGTSETISVDLQGYLY